MEPVVQMREESGDAQGVRVVSAGKGVGGVGVGAGERGEAVGVSIGLREFVEGFIVGAAERRPRRRTGATAIRVDGAMTASARVITVDPLYTAGRALALAERHGISHLPVIWSDSELLGMICVCDLWPLHTDELVVHHMSMPVITVGARESLARAAELMRENDIGSLPVLEDAERGTLGGFPNPPATESVRAKPELRPREQRLCGMLTLGDLVRAGAVSVDDLPPACMSCGSRHHVRTGVPVRTARSSATFCVRCTMRGEFAGKERVA